LSTLFNASSLGILVKRHISPSFSLFIAFKIILKQLVMIFFKKTVKKTKEVKALADIYC